MNFSGIYGHDKVKEYLSNAFELNRVPSAYLFLGENGIGKSSLVREFAQLLNCDTHNLCHTCDNCRLFDSGKHPDFHLVKRNGQFIRIAQIQELISRLSLKPAYATKRVVLIQEADRLNQESANSFLKILEEPPLDTLMVLTTSEENMLLETILSRCQKVSFSPLSQEVLKQIISERFDINTNEIGFIINYSRGRIRKDFIDKVAVLNTMRRQVLNMLCSLTLENMVAHATQVEQWVKKDLHEYFLEFSATWLKDFLYLKMGKQEQMSNRDLIDEIDVSAIHANQEQLNQAFDLVIETELAVKANAGKVLALESLIIQLKQVFQGVMVL
ncbi:MAG: DNA polymerase III subunit delta' [Proteobacteria bacterium]|nr:DNA polymerase III subunit delta' [Pseudomonadota bacterium]